jgi:SPP1 gp7 family putative phage head morphogenesis protein
MAHTSRLATYHQTARRVVRRDSLLEVWGRPNMRLHHLLKAAWPKRKGSKRVPQPTTPDRAERIYLGAARLWAAEFRRVVLEALAEQGLRFDGPDTSRVELALGVARLKIAKGTEQLPLKGIASEVDRHVTTYTGRVLGIPNSAVAKPTDLAAWQKANRDLITRTSEQGLARVAATLKATDGLRVEDIAKNLQGALGWTERRARLVARDQTLKLCAQINKDQQKAAGITHYVWRTSEDGSVRQSHDDLNGQTFSWDDPPEVSDDGRREHPGGDYQCRCTPEPVIDELSDLDSAEPDWPAEQMPEPEQAEQVALPDLTEPAIVAPKPRRPRAPPAVRVPVADRPPAKPFDETVLMAEKKRKVRYLTMQSAPKRVVQEVQQTARTVLGQDWTDQTVDDLMGLRPLAGKIESVEVEILTEEKSIAIEAHLQGGGRVWRIFNKDKTGRLVVSHELFVLPTKLRDGGLGMNVLADQIAEYKALGMSEVRTHAAWDGQFVWPNMGYRLRNPSDLKTYKEELLNWMMNGGARVGPAYEVEGLTQGKVKDLPSWFGGDSDLGADLAEKLTEHVQSIPDIQALAKFGTEEYPGLGREFLRWRGWRDKSAPLIDLEINMKDTEQMAKVDGYFARKAARPRQKARAARKPAKPV